MTEKRFEMVITGADGSFHYLDKNTGEKITSTLELENKLNELHEENEYLCEKIKENEWHWNTIDEDKDVWMYKCKKLEEENEQLKKQWKEKRHEDINELSVIAMRFKALEKENKQLKEQLSEAKTDEKQLGISFMGYKMKLIEVLQKKYDKVKGKTLYADVYTEIAEEMGVDLE